VYVPAPDEDEFWVELPPAAGAEFVEDKYLEEKSFSQGLN